MKLLAKLYIQVLIAMALAIALGLLAPEIAVKMKPLGTAFIALLKMLLGPIIFSLLFTASPTSAIFVGWEGLVSRR